MMINLNGYSNDTEYDYRYENFDEYSLEDYIHPSLIEIHYKASSTYLFTILIS